MCPISRFVRPPAFLADLPHSAPTSPRMKGFSLLSRMSCPAGIFAAIPALYRPRVTMHNSRLAGNGNSENELLQPSRKPDVQSSGLLEIGLSRICRAQASKPTSLDLYSHPDVDPRRMRAGIPTRAIPAWAGATTSLLLYRWDDQSYPRVGGGLPVDIDRVATRNRAIPAWAGAIFRTCSSTEALVDFSPPAF